MSQINDVIIGVDVSKEKLDIYINPMGHYQTVANQRKPIKKFFMQVMQEYQLKIVVLESTGGYEKACVKALDELQLKVHVAHPNQVYHYAKSKRLLAKTDKIDSKTLALFGEEAAATPTVSKSEQEQELERLVRRKQQLTDLLTQEKLRLSGPQAVGEMGRSIKRLVKQLEREMELINGKLDEGVKRCEATCEKVERLKTFKGIGQATAVLLAVSMPELGQAGRADIASLIGLAPVNHDSGKKKGYRAIKGGRFHVRKGLYMAALSAIRFNQDMKVFYERLIAKGKKAKVAIVAVMRKIIITLNALLRDNKNWESKLSFSQST